MTRLKVHAAHRLSFRFRTRKSQSTQGAVSTSESIEKSSSNQAKGCGIQTEVKQHRSVITILPKLETKANQSLSKELENKASNSMDEETLFQSEERREGSEGEDVTQDVVDVLRCILEKQSLNSSQVYSISGRQLRIDVLEDTDL